MKGSKWTPAAGARLLCRRFGAEAASRLLRDVLAGLPPGELIEEPYAGVLHLIGNGHADGVLGRWRADPDAPRLDHWPRSWAARAFAYLGDVTVGPDLAAALADEHWWVRKTAAQTLGRLGVTDQERALLVTLKDPHVRVRRVGATALGRVGSSGALDGLRAALDDDDLEVRAAADKALTELAERDGGAGAQACRVSAGPGPCSSPGACPRKT